MQLRRRLSPQGQGQGVAGEGRSCGWLGSGTSLPWDCGPRTAQSEIRRIMKGLVLAGPQLETSLPPEATRACPLGPVLPAREGFQCSTVQGPHVWVTFQCRWHLSGPLCVCPRHLCRFELHEMWVAAGDGAWAHPCGAGSAAEAPFPHQPPDAARGGMVWGAGQIGEHLPWPPTPFQMCLQTWAAALQGEPRSDHN